jgi:conjugal transfer pilus assembly protein TraF
MGFKQMGFKKILKVCLAVVCAINCVIKDVQANFYKEHATGWHWYKDPDPEALIKEEASPKSAEQERGQGVAKSYTEKLKESKKVMNEVLAQAVLEPTLTNVQRFQLIQKQTVDKATEFERLWMLASTLSADYRSATTPLEKEVFEAEQKKILDFKLKEASKRYGLFFVFKNSCPYCHKFAPLIKRFSQTYGFSVKAISADGGTIQEFPDSVSDNGAVGYLNPKGVFPALFVVQPEANLIVPVAWGMVSFDQLLENFKIVLSALEKQDA